MILLLITASIALVIETLSVTQAKLPSMADSQIRLHLLPLPLIANSSRHINVKVGIVQLQAGKNGGKHWLLHKTKQKWYSIHLSFTLEILHEQAEGAKWSEEDCRQTMGYLSS